MKLTVATPFGTFTRRSARPYKFVVVACGESELKIQTQHQACNRQAQQIIARHERDIANGTLLRLPISGWTVADSERVIAQQREYLATADARLAHSLADNAARIAAKRGNQFGWSTRRELAEKVAADVRKHQYLNVAIYEVAP